MKRSTHCFVLTVTFLCALTTAAPNAPLALQADQPRADDKPRKDHDAFRKLIATGQVDAGGRCALPDGTSRAVNAIVSFGGDRVYRCEAAWVPVSEAPTSGNERVYERRVTWTLQPKVRATMGLF